MYCELVQYVQYSGGRKVLISAEKHFPLPLPSSSSLFLSLLASSWGEERQPDSLGLG